MIHLTPDELRQWASGALDHDRARIVAHLASCGECSAHLAAIVREASAAEDPIERIDAAAFREAGRRAGLRIAPQRAIEWQRYALAAAVVLAVSGTLYLTSGRETARVERGSGEGAVVTQAPAGPVDAHAPLRFSWSGTAAGVRLVVANVSQSAPLIDRVVTGGQFEASAAERARFERGPTYHWFVEYRDATGATRTTPTVRFSLR